MSEQHRKASPRGDGDGRRDDAAGRRPRGRSQSPNREHSAKHARPHASDAPRRRTESDRPARRSGEATHAASHRAATPRKRTPRPATRVSSTRLVSTREYDRQTLRDEYSSTGSTRRAHRQDPYDARIPVRDHAQDPEHYSEYAAYGAARGKRDAGTAGRSVTTNKPFTTREPPSARARKMRRQREQARRRRQMRLALDAVVILVCVALVALAIRGVAGFVGGLVSGGSKDPKVEQESTVVEESAQQEQVAQGSDVTINLAMIGDILQHSGVFSSGFLDDGTRNYDHIFAHIGSEIEGADIKVLNQETVLGGTMFEFSGYPSFNGPQEMGDAEAKAGFNVILRATNHALDMGYDGLRSELNFWKTSHPDIAVIGAVDPSDPATSIEDVYVFEKDGFKVAMLNYTYDLNGYEDPQGAVSTLDEEHVRRTVTAANEMADMVVVFPHWGEEYNLVPVQDQYDMAKVFMDCGADVIIGGHPHVIEPVEVLTASDGRKVPCFWSVGNFVSTQPDDQNLIGGVAKVTLHKAADGTCSVEGASFVPTVTHKGLGSSMTTYLLRDWNDDLASTNYLDSNGTYNTTLTTSWANSFCTEVLGSGFDTASEQIVFGPELFVPDEVTQGEAAQGDATGTSSVVSDVSTSADATDDSSEELPEAA